MVSSTSRSGPGTNPGAEAGQFIEQATTFRHADRNDHGCIEHTMVPAMMASKNSAAGGRRAGRDGGASASKRAIPGCGRNPRAGWTRFAAGGQPPATLTAGFPNGRPPWCGLTIADIDRLDARARHSAAEPRLLGKAALLTRLDEGEPAFSAGQEFGGAGDIGEPCRCAGQKPGSAHDVDGRRHFGTGIRCRAGCAPAPGSNKASSAGTVTRTAQLLAGSRPRCRAQGPLGAVDLVEPPATSPTTGAAGKAQADRPSWCRSRSSR